MIADTEVIRVLLIEDNPGDVGLIRRMLRNAQAPSMEMLHAGTFETGLQPLRAGDADVLLLDLGLPGSSGFENIATAIAAAPHVPVIVLTGTDETQTVLECIKAGARDYFVKSRLEPRRLIEVISKAVRKSELAD